MQVVKVLVQLQNFTLEQRGLGISLFYWRTPIAYA
jgi:hypothetical protein